MGRWDGVFGRHLSPQALAARVVSFGLLHELGSANLAHPTALASRRALRSLLSSVFVDWLEQLLLRVRLPILENLVKCAVGGLPGTHLLCNCIPLRRILQLASALRRLLVQEEGRLRCCDSTARLRVLVELEKVE